MERLRWLSDRLRTFADRDCILSRRRPCNYLEVQSAVSDVTELNTMFRRLKDRIRMFRDQFIIFTDKM